MKKIKVPRYIQWIALTGVIFLLLMSLFRVVLVLAFKTASTASTNLLPSFWLGFRYDARMIAIAALLIFLIGSIPALHPFNKKWGRKIALWLWGITITALCLFYAFDFTHYAYLQQRLNSSVLNYLDDAKISMGVVWETYHVTWILLGLIVVITLLIALVRWLYNLLLSQRTTVTKWSKLGWGLAFFLICALGIFGRIGQYPLRWSDAFALGNDYQSQIALNPMQSFFSSLNFRHATFDVAKAKQHYGIMQQYLGIQKPDTSNLNFERYTKANNYDSTMNRPNIVLVICESFSSYKSSMENNPLNTTPFFKSLAEDGVYFNRCFSPAYGTARGVWATLTGVPDVQLTKTASRNPAAVDQHIIMNDFKGYEKYYFLGGSTSWANIRGVLTNNIEGLHLYEEGSYQAAKIDVWGISDKNLFLEANKVIAKEQKPFFAIIQTADNHRPYTIPEEDLKDFKKQDIPRKRLLEYGFTSIEEYNAFRYTDYTYQQFIQAAKKEKYFDNTIFVFVGDHGIKGDATHVLPDVFTTQSLTSQHVPLLFYAPGKLKPQQFNMPVSQVDIMPTIAGLASIAYRNNTLGRDLLDPKVDQHNAAAFIIDPDGKRIGIIQDSLFYSYGLQGKFEQIASIKSNQPIALTDSLRQRYRNLTDAFYETARYLLLNNKKKLR
jgi:phosphoglycerol transferase MdoB-like AlkP superfamily enzyme